MNIRSLSYLSSKMPQHTYPGYNINLSFVPITDYPNSGPLVPVLETNPLKHLLLLLGPSWLHQIVTDSILAEVWPSVKKTEHGEKSTWFPRVISQELLIPPVGRTPSDQVLLSHKSLPYWSPPLGTQLVHLCPRWHLGLAAASSFPPAPLGMLFFFFLKKFH